MCELLRLKVAWIGDTQHENTINSTVRTVDFTKKIDKKSKKKKERKKANAKAFFPRPDTLQLQLGVIEVPRADLVLTIRSNQSTATTAVKRLHRKQMPTMKMAYTVPRRGICPTQQQCILGLVQAATSPRSRFGYVLRRRS